MIGLYRNITLTGTGLQELRDALVAKAKSERWEARTEPSQGNREYVVLRFHGKPPADLWLSWSASADKASLANILPIEQRKLSTDEYNQISDKLVDEVLRPAISGLSVELNIGPSERALGDVLTPRCVAALEDFSLHANQGTVTGHPDDERRWNEFVVLCHFDHVQLERRLLVTTLLDDDWEEEAADELADRFEDARRLLRDLERLRKDEL